LRRFSCALKRTSSRGRLWLCSSSGTTMRWRRCQAPCWSASLRNASWPTAQPESPAAARDDPLQMLPDATRIPAEPMTPDCYRRTRLAGGHGNQRQRPILVHVPAGPAPRQGLVIQQNRRCAGWPRPCFEDLLRLGTGLYARAGYAPLPTGLMVDRVALADDNMRARSFQAPCSRSIFHGLHHNAKYWPEPQESPPWPLAPGHAQPVQA
jgi:hypothetical protein